MAESMDAKQAILQRWLQDEEKRDERGRRVFAGSEEHSYGCCGVTKRASRPARQRLPDRLDEGGGFGEDRLAYVAAELSHGRDSGLEDGKIIRITLGPEIGSPPKPANCFPH